MIEEFKKKLNQIIDNFKEEINQIRGHRISIDILENLKVKAYGQEFPLKSLGLLSLADHQTVYLELWDENIIGEIEKFIRQHPLNFNVQKEGKKLKINLPPMSEETRKSTLKMLNEAKEKFRIQARRVRDEFLKEIKNKQEKGELREDEYFKTREQADKEIDEFNKKLEELFKKKEEEILL